METRRRRKRDEPTAAGGNVLRARRTEPDVPKRSRAGEARPPECDGLGWLDMAIHVERIKHDSVFYIVDVVHILENRPVCRSPLTDEADIGRVRAKFLFDMIYRRRDDVPSIAREALRVVQFVDVDAARAIEQHLGEFWCQAVTDKLVQGEPAPTLLALRPRLSREQRHSVVQSAQDALRSDLNAAAQIVRDGARCLGPHMVPVLASAMVLHTDIDSRLPRIPFLLQLLAALGAVLPTPDRSLLPVLHLLRPDLINSENEPILTGDLADADRARLLVHLTQCYLLQRFDAPERSETSVIEHIGCYMPVHAEGIAIRLDSAFEDTLRSDWWEAATDQPDVTHRALMGLVLRNVEHDGPGLQTLIPGDVRVGDRGVGVGPFREWLIQAMHTIPESVVAYDQRGHLHLRLEEPLDVCCAQQARTNVMACMLLGRLIGFSVLENIPVGVRLSDDFIERVLAKCDHDDPDEEDGYARVARGLLAVVPGGGLVLAGGLGLRDAVRGASTDFPLDIEQWRSLSDARQRVSLGTTVAGDSVSPLQELFWAAVGRLTALEHYQLLYFITAFEVLPRGGFGDLPEAHLLVLPTERSDMMPYVSACTSTIRIPLCASPEVLVDKLREMLPNGVHGFTLM